MGSIDISKRKIIILSILLNFTIILLVIGVWYVNGLKKPNPKKVDVVSQLYFETVSTKKEVGRKISVSEKRKNVVYKVEYPEVGEDKIDSHIKDIVDEKILEKEKKYSASKETHYYLMTYETYIGPGEILNVVLTEVTESDKLAVLEKNNDIYNFDLRTGELLKDDEIFKESFYEKIKEYAEVNKGFSFILNNDYLLIVDFNVKVPIEEIKDYLKIDLSNEDDIESDVLEPNYKVVNKEYQLKSDAVLYEEASKTSTIVGNVKKETIVKVYQQSDKEWSSLFYGDKVVYVESNLLEEPKKPEVPVIVKPSAKKTLYAVTDVNIRAEASVNSKIVGELKYGESITKTGEVGSWTQVEYNGQVAYIASSCLSSVKIEKHEIKLNVPPQSDIDPTKPMVALTFDDGPSAKTTPRILNTLEKYNAHATFFDLGSLMLKNPDIVKREAQIGEVGTHTYSHKNLNTLSKEKLAEEIRLSKEAYVKVLGYEPKLLRPPYGNANVNVRAAITDMVIINWDVDSLDWKYRNKDLTLNEIDKYGNLDGKIILMHSIHEPTADAVEILVPDLIDRGYQIVTVSELAYYRGYKLETGTIYHNFKK